MIFFNKRKKNSNSKTLDNLGNNNFQKRNKYSRSHKTLNIYPKESINDFDITKESYVLNNSLTISDNYQTDKKKLKKNPNLKRNNPNDLYTEEINYNINDTSNKNFHETTDSSQIKKNGNYIENDDDDEVNDYNFYNNLHRNSSQKEYWFEEKNKYIQELEKKIQSQESTIDNLLKYKKVFEEKISNLNNNNNEVKKFKFASLENDINYDYGNKKLVKKLNKEDIETKTNISKFHNNNYQKNNNNINDLNRPKNNNNSQDKYNDLYSKYLQLNNDFKYLNNNNNSLNEINQLKNKYIKLQEEYKILKNKIEEKNNIIENQRNELNKIKNSENSNCKIQYIVGGEEEKEVIKNLKQQVEMFRKDLVLSQAMVNSLKSEIVQLNKRNNNLKKNNSIDKFTFTFNDNKSINKSITPASQNGKTINYNDIIYNNESAQNLINSINNKNELLTKVLSENNKLRNKLKKFDSFLPEFMDMNKNKEIEEELNDKQIIKKYEEKFKYFNGYIKNLKFLIKNIFNDIPSIINKYTSEIGNKNLSDKFVFDLYNLRKEYNYIKDIDTYNLDTTDDEKCLNIYQKIMKSLSEELEIIIKSKNSENNTNQKYIYDTQKLNIKDLNSNKSSVIEGDLNKILLKKERPSLLNNDLLGNNKYKSKSKITYISDYKSKSNKYKDSSQNQTYNFKYGKNVNEPDFL